MNRYAFGGFLSIFTGFILGWYGFMDSWVIIFFILFSVPLFALASNYEEQR